MENSRIMIVEARRGMQSHVVCQVKGECKYHDFIGWLVSFWISSAQLPIRPNPKGPITELVGNFLGVKYKESEF